MGVRSPGNQLGLHSGVGPSLDPFPIEQAADGRGGAWHLQSLTVCLMGLGVTEDFTKEGGSM